MKTVMEIVDEAFDKVADTQMQSQSNASTYRQSAKAVTPQPFKIPSSPGQPQTPKMPGMPDIKIPTIPKPKIAEEDLPGYLALRRPVGEAVKEMILPGAIPGGFAGLFGAAFHPGISRAIPNDKIRMLAGLLGGGALGAGVGGGTAALIQAAANARSRQLEHQLGSIKQGDTSMYWNHLLKKSGEQPSEEEVRAFFASNPTPSDDEFHAWAESKGYEPDDAEEIAYRLAAKQASDLIPGGRAAGKTDSQYPAKQIEMGQKVEHEHTPDVGKTREIARDHLEEFPTYYTALKKMEDELKAKEKVPTQEKKSSAEIADELLKSGGCKLRAAMLAAKKKKVKTAQQIATGILAKVAADEVSGLERAGRIGGGIVGGGVAGGVLGGGLGAGAGLLGTIRTQGNLERDLASQISEVFPGKGRTPLPEELLKSPHLKRLPASLKQLLKQWPNRHMAALQIPAGALLGLLGGAGLGAVGGGLYGGLSGRKEAAVKIAKRVLLQNKSF